MKLSLKNFRHHLSLDVDLPSTGLVRINGRSGAGKSSVLHAVRFALFGSGRGITTWNEKTTEVELRGMGLDLKRTKGPNKVDCNGYSGTSADMEIARVLGMNELEFSISSYVSQGQRSSLINLTPADQLNLIHALSFRDENPEERKEIVKNYVRQQEESLHKLQEDRVRLEERASGTRRNLESVASVLRKPEKTRDELECEKTEKHSLLAEKKAVFAALKARNEEIKKSLEHSSRKKVDEAKKQLASAEEKIKELEQELDSPQNRVEHINWDVRELEMQDLQKELAQITSRYKALKSVQRNSVDSDRLELIVSESLNKIHALIAFGGVSREDDKLEDDLLVLKSSSEAALTALESLKFAVSPEEREKNETETQEISKRINEINAAVQDFLQAKKKEESALVKLRLLRENLEAATTKKFTAISVIEQNREIEDTSSLEEELHRVREQGIALSGEINSLQTALSSCDHALSEIENYEKGQEKIRALQVELTKTEAALAQNEKETESAVQEHKNAQKIQTLWVKAALDVIESTIAEINLRAAFWLDTLLEGRVSAELKTTKKMKSKNETIDSINLEIMYKGQTLEKVHEDLSGGQYSRVMLAFQLALSDLYNSPILMLDEAARGCDIETIELMLDALRTVSKRKLVIIVEHNIPNFHFDKEIYLDEV